MFPKTPKFGVWCAGILAMQINIGIPPFMKLAKMWTFGGIILTLNILIYCWLGSAFLVGCAADKGWTQERVNVLKTVATLALLIIGFTLVTYLVLGDGNDDLRKLRTDIAVLAGIVLFAGGSVVTIPRNREKTDVISHRLKIVYIITLIVVTGAVAFVILAF